MKEQPNPTNIPALLKCIKKAEADGYATEFEVTEAGLHEKDDTHYFKPDEIFITDFVRFELASDPSENSIVYLVETKDGRKGIMINAYGDYADPVLASFIKEVKIKPKHLRQ